MFRLPVLAALAAAQLALAPATAQAFICYMVLDKSDTAIYRDQLPPVDMSAAGAPAREQMRQRGELLIIMDAADKCQRILPARAGSAPLSANEVLADAPSMQTGMAPDSSPISGSGSSRGVTAAMPTATTPVAAPALSGGTSSGATGMRTR